MELEQYRSAFNTDKIIGQIYDASLNPELWTSVLANVAYYTQCKSAIFTAIDQLNPEYDFTYTHNIPEEALKAYQEEKIQIIDMRLHAPILLKAGIGEPAIAYWKHYIDMPDTDEYVFYERCLKPTGIGSGNGILLENGKFRWAVFAVHRAIDAPEFNQQDLQNIKFLGDHLRRALQIHRQIATLKQETKQVYNLLDYLKIGVLILDHESRVIYANQKAKVVLESSSILALDNFNRLKTVNKDQALLNTYILGALFQSSKVQDALPIGGVLGLEKDTHKNLMLSIVPISKLDHLGVTSIHENKVAIFITEPHDRRQLANTYMQQLYKLTKRELEICEFFVNGCDLKEIAQQCEITYETTRFYIKNIYEKTNCTSQMELMQLLLGLTISFEHISNS